MRKIITAFLMIAGIMVGGLVSAAPASANWGTEVFVAGVPLTHPNAWIKTTNMNGLDKILHNGETAHNVAKFCPTGTNYELTVQGPGGSQRFLDPGQCYVPTNEGQYLVWIHLA